MPRNIEHELWNDTEEFAQLIEIYTPPGMEQKFAAAGAAAIAGGKGFADADDYAASRSELTLPDAGVRSTGRHRWATRHR